MHDFLLKNYISKLTINDIDSFSHKQGINLNKEELKLIEKHIKQNWKTIIYGNPQPILDDIKNNTTELKYKKIENLYIEFKNKYKNYL